MNLLPVLFLFPLIVGNLWVIVSQLAQPPTDLKPKIFVIGLSRTGTTSIGNALALLGYKRIGWKDIRSRHLVNTYAHGDLAPLIEQTQYFDAFEDLPWPYVFKQMAETYPDAKFILSLRKDEKTWLRSMRRYLGNANWRPATYFYGAHQVDGNEETVLKAYRDHTAAVRAYFKTMPERYSELVIDDGDANWRFLCKIAECPAGGLPAVDFPMSNTAADWDDQTFFGRLHWTWVRTIIRIEEMSIHYYYDHGNALVKTALETVWRGVSSAELAIAYIYHLVWSRSYRVLPVAQGEVPITRGRDD